MDQTCVPIANTESGVRGKRTARGYVCFPRDGAMEGGGGGGNVAYMGTEHSKRLSYIST